MQNSQHVLIIGYVWPEPDSSAAGRRMMQLISSFQDQGWTVTFASAAAESEHRANLSELDINQVSIEINSSDFDEFISQLKPSIVVFDRYITEEQFGWRVAQQCPEALRILDTEDLHFLRKARGKAIRQNRTLKDEDLLTEDTAKREIASVYRCDLSLIISEAEMDLLKNKFGIDDSLLHYLPFLLEPIDKETKRQWPSFEKRRHFVSIGNFRHPPNMDAVKYLKKKIWPLIRKKLPRAEMHSYGSYPTQHAMSLHDPEQGFFIEGRAGDAQAVVHQAKVSLAPLRFGAGLKGKLVESMQCGTPSVTTSIGAEGIAGKLDWSGALAEDPEVFAREAVELYLDKSAWQKAQENGIKIINKRFQKKEFIPSLVDRIKKLYENLQLHRNKNFIGQMLQHHRMASTKYMSRWIEAKNKNQ
jgi:glycosyltransferase involved in cell wall biosynthesis